MSDLRLHCADYGHGVAQGSEVLIRRVKASPRTTYLLRSVNVNKSDILVAVRVEEFLSDGSAVLAWIKLRDFPPTNPLA